MEERLEGGAIATWETTLLLAEAVSRMVLFDGLLRGDAKPLLVTRGSVAQVVVLDPCFTGPVVAFDAGLHLMDGVLA